MPDIDPCSRSHIPSLARSPSTQSYTSITSFEPTRLCSRSTPAALTRERDPPLRKSIPSPESGDHHKRRSTLPSTEVMHSSRPCALGSALELIDSEPLPVFARTISETCAGLKDSYKFKRPRSGFDRSSMCNFKSCKDFTRPAMSH